jgi:hypothetical protein
VFGVALEPAPAAQQALQCCLQQILARLRAAAQQRRDPQQRLASLGEELLELGYPLVCGHPQPPECRSPHQSTNGRPETLMATVRCWPPWPCGLSWLVAAVVLSIISIGKLTK